MAQTIILLLLCVILWIFNFLTTKRFYTFSYRVGGPWGLPFIGVLHRLISMKDLLYTLPTMVIKNKSAFFWMAYKPTFYTYDPEKIEKILLSPHCINKSGFYDVIDQEIGSGIMTSKSPTWDKHRKLLNPCFTHKILLSFFPTFNKESNEVLEKLDQMVGLGEKDLWKLLQNFSLQTAYAVSVGEEVSHSVVEGLTFIGHIERYLSTVFKRSTSILLRYNSTFKFHKSYKGYQKSKEFVHEFVRNLLKKKLTEVEDKEKEGTGSTSITPKDSIDIVKPRWLFIDLAIDIHRKNLLSWEDVCNEAYVVIAAAFETSATTMNNMLMFIAMHPEYQEKLYEEVLSVFPEKKFDVKFEQLEHLVYMDMVIDETLRVAPSVPLISRKVSKDAEIGENLWIPRGTMVIIDIFNLHRCKEFWGSDANKFNPDNFLLKNVDGRHPYAYIPFSKGPRNCIGWRYARMLLKVGLSKIIRNYRISTTFRYEDLRCVQNLSLRYEVKPKLEIHRR